MAHPVYLHVEKSLSTNANFKVLQKILLKNLVNTKIRFLVKKLATLFYLVGLKKLLIN